MNTQLDYIYYALTQSGGYPKTWAAFQKANDTDEATRIMYQNHAAPKNNEVPDSPSAKKALEDHREKREPSSKNVAFGMDV